MEKYFWIKELVLEEQDMEREGMVDFSTSTHPENSLEKSTLEFLRLLKNQFQEACSTYNSFKTNPIEQVKLYGVSKTKADFMLFRHGFKLIFSMKLPGTIQVYSSQLPTGFLPTSPDEESPMANPIRHVVKAKWGAFEELQWTFKGEEVRVESLVRYYFSLFTKYSRNH